MMKIGFVGLGEIGTEMVKRLRAADYPVTVYGRGQGLTEAEKAGATISKDYAAIAAGCDVLIVCVYRDPQVREILFDHGMLVAMKPGAVLINHTTGSPSLIREVAEHATGGQLILDATFSGGPADVAGARLTLMIGGDEASIDAVRPVLSTYASQLFAVGAIGSGQLMKLLNNLLFGTNIMNAVELLKLAEAQGLDTQRVAQVIHAASGASYAMDLFRAAPSVSGMMDGARPYMEKDVATALSAAREAGLDVGVFAVTGEYFASPNV